MTTWEASGVVIFIHTETGSTLWRLEVRIIFYIPEGFLQEHVITWTPGLLDSPPPHVFQAITEED